MINMISASPLNHTPLRWSYGVTTVPERRSDTLPATLFSLREAGFDSLRLFVDGDNNEQSWRDEFKLEVTYRNPRMRALGNWMMAAWELFIRNPLSDMFAIFQDDIVAYKNLRPYLEACKYPRGGYLNLYTDQDNQSLVPTNPQGGYHNGWWASNQRGRGALGLVFSREALATLLAHPHTVERFVSAIKNGKSIDGCVVESLSDRHLGPKGWKEYIHSPSLIQHTSVTSIMGVGHNATRSRAPYFLGSEFDAMSLLDPSLNTDETFQTVNASLRPVSVNSRREGTTIRVKDAAYEARKASTIEAKRVIR